MKDSFPQTNKKREALSLKERVLSFFYPPLCAACGRAGFFPLCDHCAEEMERVFRPRKFLAFRGNGFADEMTALFPYEAYAVKHLIYGHKRFDYPEYRIVFRAYMEKAKKKGVFRKKIDLITFAPRRAAGRAVAGFDQGEVLAKICAEVLGIPFEELLIREKAGTAQRHLSLARRKKNVTGAFSAARELAGETVLLVDDVVTTGVTVKEAARILKKAGAQKVYVLCYAHPFS